MNASRQEAFLYHATPLHYLPRILQSGALYAKSVLAAQGIAPRASALRRDRMLGLADWVHLSFRPDTPLLRDKLAKGYPHALLLFEREAVFALPQFALLPCNTKAWRTRSACQPITDSAEQATLLRCHEQTGRYPSLEALAHYGLDLTLMHRIVYVTPQEREAVEALLDALSLPKPASQVADTGFLPASAHYQPAAGGAIAAYFQDCLRVAALLPPPPIPFD